MVTYAILMALLVVALIAGLSLSWDRSSDRVRQLRERLELVEQAQKRQQRASLTLIRDDLLSEIPALNRWLEQIAGTARLKVWLRQAAVTMRPGKFVLLCAAAGLGCGLTGMFLYAWAGLIVGAALGAWLPYAYVGRRRSRRMAAFQAHFPEAIELLVRASRAGHPPSAALELIASEMADPIAGEFRQVFDQQRFGLPLRDCLLNLAQRVPLVDVQFFAISVIIQRESGGNLAEILEKLSNLIRERVQIQRQVKTHTAQGRMTLWVLMGLAPLLLVAMLLLSHNFVAPIFTDPMGRAMLGCAAVLQLIGLMLLRKIVDIQV